MPAEERDASNLASDAGDGTFVDVVDRAPVGGDLGGAVHVASSADPFVLASDLVGAPNEVVEPLGDETALDRLALGMTGDDRGDAFGRRLGNARGALGHEQQHAIVGCRQVGEVQLPILRVVQAGD